MELPRVLGEDVKGAFLEEDEAAYLRFPTRVSTRFVRSVGIGMRDRCCNRNVIIIDFSLGALQCRTLANRCFFFVS